MNYVLSPSANSPPCWLLCALVDVSDRTQAPWYKNPRVSLLQGDNLPPSIPPLPVSHLVFPVPGLIPAAAPDSIYVEVIQVHFVLNVSFRLIIRTQHSR